MQKLGQSETPSLIRHRQQHYAKGSPQRDGLYSTVESVKKRGPVEVPIVVGGKEVGFSLLHSAQSDTD